MATRSNARKTASPTKAAAKTETKATEEKPSTEAPAPDAQTEDAPPATEGTESTGPQDAPAPDGEVDPGADSQDDAPDAGADEKPTEAPSEAPRQSPAAAELEAPAAPAAPQGIEDVSRSRVVNDHSGQLSVDLLVDKPAELTTELYDASTGKAPNPDEMFVQEFAHGTQMVCRIRLCERMWVPGHKTPTSRLVMAQGQRTEQQWANRIIALVKAQQPASTEADDQE